MTPRYHINVFWSDEDRCWLADVPDLSRCTAHGDTPEAAVREVHDAMTLWLESARDRDDRVHEPRYS